ncbi:NAD(P)-dependent oxidoreductase [Aspergillus lucknowensis]|uniref:NAD(P)-binding protein n=1 Tax=Aspergillus lucknowensis TaxID=176173 RepID=A0ABR4LEC6_9EURO
MVKVITLLGLGAMGKALAQRYIDTGYATTVWNRTPGKADALLEKGAKLATTVSESLSAADLVIVCLLDNASVRETLSKAPTSSLRGKTIVNLTNGTPSQARELSEWITSSGAAGYIHGGIMAIPVMIGSPHAVLLCSGNNAAAFAAVEADLAHLGTAKFLGTDPGSASLHDLALLSGMYGLFAGFFQATALATSQPGNTATGFLSLLVPWLTAMTQSLAALAEQIDSGDYTTRGSNLAMQVAAIPNMIAASEEQGVSPRLVEPIFELMKRAVEGGYGGADISAVIEYTKDASNSHK